MAFDGITVSCLVKELNDNILNGRIAKIAQPESDELLLTIKGISEGQKRLLISASASLPLIYFTENNKPSPITAPNFCMLLRKHISNGRITQISQPSLERVIFITIEHLDEMGDLRHKKLAIELMGKHSNIIFINEDNIIIDAIKHIPSSVSSVREVLPGREYFIPETTDKADPLTEDYDGFSHRILKSNMPIFKAIYSNYTGISPFFSQELCYEALIDGDMSTDSLKNSKDSPCILEGMPAEFLDNEETSSLHMLFNCFTNAMESIKCGEYEPQIVYENGVPQEYSVLPLMSYQTDNKINYSSISELLENYYKEKAQITRIRQKSTDLRKIVDTILERDLRKYELQLKQMKDTEKKDKYKVYGELLNTYGYNAAPNAKSITVLNYYTNEELTIPLDPDLTPIDNAKKYFEKYNKLKRTKEALESLIIEVKAEIDHLESISNSLDIAANEDDLIAIKEEMTESGYIRRNRSEKKPKIKSQPFHYITPEGFHIYVGKNNIQNEEITFKLANGNDWWFHAKKTPGSHVVVKTEGKELPDSVFETAAKLAAHYSKAKGSNKVEVDYVRRKEVKHPNGSKPGFVVYYTNYSMLIDSDISQLPLTIE